MKATKLVKEKLSISLLPFFFCCLFIATVSCSVSSTVDSLDSRFAEIDILISVNDYNEAWSLLKKVAKNAHRPYDKLGVVRRALLLEKTDYAQKMLIEAIKTFPDNQELLAVYTHLLMTKGLYDKALENAYKLEGGKYGSLYSELRFKTDGKIPEDENIKDFVPIDYYSIDYLQAYLDIAEATGDGRYLRNASMIQAFHGTMPDAFVYHPTQLSSYDNPWFWAQISYDSLNFMQCIEDLRLIEDSSESLALLADAYLQIGDKEAAQKVWLSSIELFPDENPESWYNVARSSLFEGRVREEHDFLLNLVDRFPDYLPGLTAYGQATLPKPIKSFDTVFSTLLEDRGIQTLQMEATSDIPQIPLSDALYRMEESLARSEKDNPLGLLFEYTKLLWDSSVPPTSDRQRIIDIWALLERHAKDPFGYDPVLVQYVVWYFFSQNMIAEADELFATYCRLRYAGAVETRGFENLPFDGMDDWEYEFGAYIAFRQKRYAEAEEWLQFFVHDSTIGYITSISAILNLATLYNSSGRRTEALNLYTEAAFLTSDKYLLSDIYYNIALILYSQNEIRNTVLMLNQCLSFNSGHNAARLLLKKINVVE